MQHLGTLPGVVSTPLQDQQAFPDMCGPHIENTSITLYLLKTLPGEYLYYTPGPAGVLSRGPEQGPLAGGLSRGP